MKVAAFYRFLDIASPEDLRDDLQEICDAQHLRGTILVATEGCNGTLAGAADAIRRVFTWIESRLELSQPIDAHWTEATQAPFRRMRVRLKPEIVALGRPDLRPQEKTGDHVSPVEWSKLIDDPDVLLVDTRNRYEFEAGTFPGAVQPGTDSFREFPEFAKELAENAPDRQLAMFCTGGIRCEKATALMLELGFDNVYQLQGGILNYLSEVAEEDNRWSGDCFVFDDRVVVDRDLAEGRYVQCHACRRPLSCRDLRSPDYREGGSCPHCVDERER